MHIRANFKKIKCCRFILTYVLIKNICAVVEITKNPQNPL